MTEVIVARIREARELRGKEQQWLANQVSLNRTDISRIENGKRHVKAVELSAIAEALDLPIGWFLRNTPPVVASRRATLHSKGSTDFNVALEKIVFIVSRLVDIGVIRARRRTVYDFPRTHDDAQLLSQRVREAAGLGQGPLDDLGALCESFGMLPFALPFTNSPFDGSMVEIDTGEDEQERGLAVALVNNNTTNSRARFTLAHELGHWLFGDPYSTCDHGGSQEQMVNSFAAYLLMPRSFVASRWREARRKYTERDTAIFISAECGTSWSSTLLHLQHLDLLAADRREALAQDTPTKGDFEVLGIELPLVRDVPEIPQGYKVAVLKAFQDRRITTGTALDSLLNLVDETHLPKRMPRKRSRAQLKAINEALGM